MKLTDYNCNLYDSSTGESCVTEKVVNVTENCSTGHNDNRFLLAFTRDSRGQIVQFVNPYPNEKYMGTCTHFYLDSLSQYMRPEDDTFGSWVVKMGMSRKQLIDLIHLHSVEE